MSATLSPVDDDLLTGLRAGDERALERVFRNQFWALAREAADDTSDVASDQRAVEDAFARAWHERSRFHTPEALEMFLHEAVHEEAVRERRRRAALHRFEARVGAHVPAAGDGRTSVDAAWERLSSALHAPAPDAAAVAHRRADLSRHAAAEHMAAMAKSRRRWVAKLAGVVITLVVVVAGFWWLDRAGAAAVEAKSIDAPDAHVVSSKIGQRAATTLNDGSSAILGADSRLQMPALFGSGPRALKLEGTAMFVVAAGPSRPFEVRVRNATVTSRAGTLVVRAYPNDDAVTVRVREGAATVGAGRAERALGAGEALVVRADGTMREPSAAALDEALGWTDGRLAVSERPLREVLPVLRRWYALDLTPADPALLERSVTMSAGIESSHDAIAALESAAGVRLAYEGKSMLLRDARTSAKAKVARRR